MGFKIKDGILKKYTEEYGVTAVTIPDGVTSIGDSAFYECKSLISITIPDSVTSIGEWAFENCTSLTSITIPDGVTSIGNDAFYNCKSLTSITIPDSVTSISDSAFWGTPWLEEYPDDLVIINDILHKYKGNASTVIIPESVTSIGDWAFHDCTSLTSITIPDNVASIGESAFWGCTSLTNITIPNSVKSIGEFAFEDCTSLTAIKVSPQNKNYCDINGVLFNKDKTEIILYPNAKVEKTYSIPDSVTSIGINAFSDCESLTGITIPDSVTSIGNCAFWKCKNLTSITIPDSVTSVGGDAFHYCYSLTSIIIHGNELKIDCAEIEKAKESVDDALGMLLTKDFSRKFSHKVKFKLIIDYFFCTGDEDAKIYIKKNFTKAMKQLIENGDVDRISKILGKTDFVTKRNIDKFITYATDNQQQQIQTILNDYKNQTFK